MTTPLPSPGYPDYRLPDFLVLNVADLVLDFQYQWQLALSLQPNDVSFKPNFKRVVRFVLEAIRLEIEAEQELGVSAYYDIAALPHYSVDANSPGGIETYSRTNATLANLTVKFGKAMISRLKEDGTYRSGYLPYHFRGWIGDTVLVALDERHGGSKLKAFAENVHYYPKQANHPHTGSGI